MRIIPLTQGKVAIVDDSDFDWLNQWKWCAFSNYSGGKRYAIRSASPKLLIHRLILSPPKGYESDHIDGDGLNNQRVNLRVCTTSQNQQNRINQKGISQFKGVSWHKLTGKWQVRICLNGKFLHIGLFNSEIDAAKAYDSAALKYFGEFARLNLN